MDTCSRTDIKLENILIKGSEFSLCDFGSATTTPVFPHPGNRSKVQSDIEENTTSIYRSPEMVDLYMDKWIDEKVDVWVCGSVL